MMAMYDADYIPKNTVTFVNIFAHYNLTIVYTRQYLSHIYTVLLNMVCY